MRLTDTEYCRAFAFVELLKLTLRGATVETLPHLNERAIMALQDGTERRASDYAALHFPHVSFADETKREETRGVELIGEADELADEDEPTQEELDAIGEITVN